MSQPNIPKNRKDTDYGSKPKKHYDATPSDTGTTDQPIGKSAPFMPASIVGKVILFVIVAASFAQIYGVIDVIGFLNPNSPTYLDVNSILSPYTKSNMEKLLYGEDSPDDDVGLDDSFLGRDLINNPSEDSTSTNPSKTSCQRYLGTSCESGTCCCSVQKGSGSPASNGMPAMPDATVLAFIVPENCECPTDMTDLHSPQATPTGMYKMCKCNAC